jgi:hypothetical protein
MYAGFIEPPPRFLNSRRLHIECPHTSGFSDEAGEKQRVVAIACRGIHHRISWPQAVLHHQLRPAYRRW